jgi:syntaxin 5
MDRTREFLQCARDKSGDKSSALNTNKKVKTRSAFQDAAGEIALGIHHASQTLAKLSKLVQRQGLFDDPTEEINSLIYRIKEELGDLNSKCDSAQQYVDTQKNSRSNIDEKSGEGAHQGKVVNQLKTGLASATKDFKSVLEMRSSKIKDQQTRKEALTGGRGLLSPSSSSSLQRRKAGGDGDGASGSGSSNAGGEKYHLPYGGPINNNDNNNYGDGNGDDDDVYSETYNPALQSVQEQQFLLAPPAQYFEARERAVGEVESTIAELGNLFKRLTTMIQEQGELVERIDEDIENAVTTVDSASDVLQKAYDAASGNATLYTKLGAILLFFIIFFTVFLM